MSVQGIAVSTTRSHAPPVLPPGPSAPVVGHLVLGGQTALYIPLKDGRYIKIPFRTQQQADDHQALHAALLTPPVGHAYPPGTVINMAAGTLECNGRTIEWLHQDPVKSRQLQELRQIFHDATGTTYSNTPWQFYLPGDRAPFNEIPPAFQQLNQGKLLQQIEFKSADEQNALGRLAPNEQQKARARYHIGNRLLSDVPAFLGTHQTAVSALNTLESQSRAAQLRKTADHFEKTRSPCRRALIEFAAYHPLALTGPTANRQTQLNAQYQTALTYLQTATGRVAGTVFNRKEDAQLMDQLAKEMALISCTTPEDYEMGCLHFGVDKTQTSPELFLIRLAEEIRANNDPNDTTEIQEYIDQGMKLCFPHLNHPEDRAAMAHELLRIADHMIDRGPNGTIRNNHTRQPFYPGIGLP